MSERVIKAIAKKRQGYNCAQCVVCAYCDLFGIGEKEAFMISEGFGGGMAGLQMTCGAVSAMAMLAGLKNSSGNLDTPNSKASTYAAIRELAKEFQNKNSSLICAELKGLTGGKMLRSCEGCIEDACHIFEEFLNKSQDSEKVSV